MRAHTEISSTTTTVPEPEEFKRRTLAILEEAYLPSVINVDPEFLSYGNFITVLYRLEMQSSPGYPYYSEAPTIGAWLKFDGINFDDFQVNRLWSHVCCLIDGDQEMRFTAFLKEEPHSVAKQESGRFRLILASPLHFQVLWHMVFDRQNDAEIKKSLDIPSQQGIILPKGNWKLYYKKWTTLGYDTGLDKRSWDWSVPWWKLCWELELRSSLLRGDLRGWRSMAERLYRMAFVNPEILLSNGMVFRQVFPGIMKSGLVNTISTNSHCQLIDHVLACLMTGKSVKPLPSAVGDDTLQLASQVADLNVYKRLGVLVKSASQGLEFVGHEFYKTGPEPIYLEKHLANAVYISDDVELMVDYFDSMCRLYANSKQFQFWYRVAENIGIADRLHTHNFYWNWYNYDLDG